MPIVVVGLGPGPYELLTLQAARALESAPIVRLRTARHPTVDSFPPTIRWTSFDHLYDTLPDFEQVYAAIAEALLAEARSGTRVVYAVPGDPTLGETSVALLRERAAAEGIGCQLVAGVPFLGPTLQAIPPLEAPNLQLVEALHAQDVDPTVPLLVYQVYSPAVASELKLDLLRRFPPEQQVFVVRAAGLPEQSVQALPLAELDRRAVFDHLTTLAVPALPPEAATRSIQGLRAIIRRLRGPQGCPWDREQTHQSIRQYVIEEAYEVADAIDADDPAELKEELGDLLLQVVLHAQIADDQGEFDFDDVVHRLAEKLVGRHPHVFGDVTARTAAEVVRNWEALKRAEKGEQGPPRSAMAGVPRSMPALRAAQEIYRRAGEAGYRWPGREWAWERVQATAQALRQHKAGPDAWGELALLLARLAADQGVDLETALERANRRFVERFQAAEAARTMGQPIRLGEEA